MGRIVKFVSYTGIGCGLQGGILTLNIDGVDTEMTRFGPKNAVTLRTGGGIAYCGEAISYGPWHVMVSDDLKDVKDQIVSIIHDNIPEGCCGGCI